MQYDNHISRYHAYWLIMAACGKSSFDDWSAA